MVEEFVPSPDLSKNSTVGAFTHRCDFEAKPFLTFDIIATCWVVVAEAVKALMRRFSTQMWVTIAVVAHLIVTLIHGQAHTSLGIELSNWQQSYVLAVILVAPLVALALSFTRYVRAGLWLLFASMLGSLIFGACYHYIIISPDHVAHLPAGEARGLFRVTAVLLLITETFGTVVPVLLKYQKQAV